MLFTVEVRDEEDLKKGEGVVEFFLDKESLVDLLKQLSFLKKEGDHAHFMTKSWGGSELTEVKQNPKGTIINHLKINFLGD